MTTIVRNAARAAGAPRGKRGSSRSVPRQVALAAVLALVAAALPAQTLDEVLGNYYRAAGGLERLKAVQAMRVSGRMILGQGLEGPFVRTTKRPRMVRVEFTLQGVTGVQAFDGETAWWFMPFMGHTGPQNMPGDIGRSMAEEADFDGPLVDYTSRGIRVELLGQEQVDGVRAFRIKATLPGGDVTYYFLDAAHYLPIRSESERNMAQQGFTIVTTLGDYRPESGIMMPHSVKVNGNQPVTQSFVVEKVELNPVLDDAMFRMPSNPDGGPQ